MTISNYSTKFYSGDKALNSYLNDIRKYKVPTKEEEEEIFARVKSGDQKAKTELINRNQRFIYSLAKIYSRDESEVLDYVNEGNIGLIAAIDSFDVTKGTKFITHAVWYIRRQMNYYLTATNNLISKPNNMKLTKKLDKIRQAFLCENGYGPTNEEVVELLKQKYDIDVKDVSDVYDVNVSSISEEIDDDYTMEENSEFNDKTCSMNLYEEDVEKSHNEHLVCNILARLDDKQRDIIRMAFGIGYDRKYSSEEIGDKYQMDKYTINELKNAIIQYLRQNKNEWKIAI
jgi:RNA polymerase primary sigma factor